MCDAAEPTLGGRFTALNVYIGEEGNPGPDTQTFTSIRQKQECSKPRAGGRKGETGAQISEAENRGVREGGGEEGPEAALGLVGTSLTLTVGAGS